LVKYWSFFFGQGVKAAFINMDGTLAKSSEWAIHFFDSDDDFSPGRNWVQTGFFGIQQSSKMESFFPVGYKTVCLLLAPLFWQWVI
jgi:hypothetical protein